VITNKHNDRRLDRGPFPVSWLFHSFLACLHDQNKSGFFWRAGFYPANQSNLKSIQTSLIGWKKAGPPKKHFCFDHVNRLLMLLTLLCDLNKLEGRK